MGINYIILCSQMSQLTNIGLKSERRNDKGPPSEYKINIK